VIQASAEECLAGAVVMSARRLSGTKEAERESCSLICYCS
jgi:hypothetical protein